MTSLLWRVPEQSEAEYASHPNAGSSRLRWCGETEDAGVLAEQEGGREEGQGVTEHKQVRAYLEKRSNRIPIIAARCRG